MIYEMKDFGLPQLYILKVHKFALVRSSPKGRLTGITICKQMPVPVAYYANILWNGTVFAYTLVQTWAIGITL